MNSNSTADSADRFPLDPPLGPPPDALSDLLDRLTARLRVDPELRLEVRQELRSHLEESIAQFQTAGRSDDEARAEAIRALGDEQDLAEQLWRANRRRLRIRAAATWATRLLLPVLALALIHQLNRGVVAAWALGYHTTGAIPHMYAASPLRQRQIADDYRAAVVAAAPQDVKSLFQIEDAYGQERMALAKQLVDAHPDDAALYANYAGCALSRNPLQYAADQPRPKINQPILDDTLAILAEGERREPDNALYPILTAGLLFQSSFTEKAEPSLTRRRPGQKWSDEWARAEVWDPPRYARALDALHRAAGKPYYRAYTGEVEKRRLNAIPLHRLADIWLSVNEEVRTLMPTLNYLRTATWGGTLRAVDAMREGKRDEADRLLREMKLLPGIAAADADKDIELHVANDTAGSLLTAEAFAHEVAGDSAGAAAAWARVDQNDLERRNLFLREGWSYDDARRRAGILYSMFPSPWSGQTTTIDVAPMRKAEYAAFDQIGFGGIASAALILAAVYAIVAAIAWLRAPRYARPPRLFVGWPRVVKIVAVGAILPVAVYFIYAYLTPLGGRGFGLNVTLGRVAIEYVLVASVVMVLLGALTRRAVRRRAMELGLSSWPSDRVPRIRFTVMAGATVLALLCLAATIALAFEWVETPVLPTKSAWIAPVAMIMICWSLLLGAGVMRWKRNGSPGVRLFYAGTVARSAFPVVLIAAVCLSLLGLPLRYAETRNVAAAANAAGAGPFLNTINSTTYQTMRARLIEQRESVMRAAPKS